MLLGKRSRPPMKRTTSMTEFTLDLNIGFGGIESPPSPLSLPLPLPLPLPAAQTSSVVVTNTNTNGDRDRDQRFLNSIISPRPNRRNSADFQIETAHFLRACFLCKRRLIPGRDIYMYKGDSAFCSLECRQQQMTRDDRKEKFSLSSKSSSSAVAGATTGGNTEIVSAAAAAAAAV